MGESVALNPIRYLSVTTMEKRRQNLKEKLKMYQSVARWERSQTLNPIINLLKKTWKRGMTWNQIMNLSIDILHP